jgi:hypothetical protein
VCLAVYITTSVPVAPLPWDAAAPAFHVDGAKVPSSLRKRFGPTPVYYLGSREGCGCGFLRDGKEGESLVRSRADLDALTAFISTVAPSKVFICWWGEQGAKPKQLRDVSLAEARDVGVWADAVESSLTPLLLSVRAD